MNSLLLHPQTQQQVGSFTSKPLHALLLLGPAGSGKRTLAENIAALILDIKSERALDSYPYFLRLKAPTGKQEISIDSVRQVIRELRLNTPGKQSVRRVVLIDSADKMSLEAQNALLKILEEPSSSTVFILTAPTAHSVLPTVASRAQHIYIRPVSYKFAKNRYQKQLSDTKIQKAWLLSRGNVGLLQALLFDEVPHPLKAAVEEAKKLIRQDQYQRLIALGQLSNNKQALAQLLDALARVLRALYSTQLEIASTNRRQKILDSWQLIGRLQDALESNVNSKLITLELALNLKV